MISHGVSWCSLDSSKSRGEKKMDRLTEYSPCDGPQKKKRANRLRREEKEKVRQWCESCQVWCEWIEQCCLTLVFSYPCPCPCLSVSVCVVVVCLCVCCCCLSWLTRFRSLCVWQSEKRKRERSLVTEKNAYWLLSAPLDVCVSSLSIALAIVIPASIIVKKKRKNGQSVHTMHNRLTAYLECLLGSPLRVGSHHHPWVALALIRPLGATVWRGWGKCPMMTLYRG